MKRVRLAYLTGVLTVLISMLGAPALAVADTIISTAPSNTAENYLDPHSAVELNRDQQAVMPNFIKVFLNYGDDAFVLNMGAIILVVMGIVLLFLACWGYKRPVKR